MPFALVAFSRCVSIEYRTKVMESLPAIIVDALDVPDHPPARLTVDDIEAIVMPDNALNIIHKDVNVIVLANEFEARVRNGQERSDMMREKLRSMLPQGMRGFVYLRLTPAFYSEF